MAALLWWTGRAGPVAALLVLLAAPGAHACRIVDPRPIVIEPAPPERPAPRVRPIETRRHQAEITVDGQTASVEVEAAFHNPNGRELEGTYFFPLPADVAVQRFSLFMNGTEVAAELLNADRARAVYEDIVRRRKDPGLLEYVGMQMIKLRVYPIPANGDVKIRLRYAHLLRRHGVWTDDTAFDPAATPTRLVAVTFLDKAYFDLLREHPELGAVLALGENVIVEVDGVVYKVTSGDQ